MSKQRNTAGRIIAAATAVMTAGFVAACAGNEPTAARLMAPRDASLSGVPVSRPGDGVAQVEFFEICKVYAEGTGPSVDFAWALTGGPDVGAPGSSGTITLAAGECREIWMGDGVNDTITVTETVPTGYAASWSKDEIIRTGPVGGSTQTTTYGPFDGNVAIGRVGGGVLGAAIPGTTVTFTNTLIPVPPPNLEGRMTGGGYTVAGVKITGGFTVHCDITLSNNLEINWNKNKWHLDKPITSALCLDDPNVDPTSPVAPFDTFIGEATGQLNGVDGSLVKFTFVDAGEPGRNDMVKLQIFPPGGGTPVLDIPLSKLDIGNLQAHYDQPHGQKP